MGDFSPLTVDDLGPFSGGGGDLVGQQCLKGLGELAAHVLGVVDVDLLEDRLVELAADDRGGVEVGSVPVGREGEGFGEMGFGLVELDVDHLEAGFGLFEFPGDAPLLGLQQLERYGVGVVGLEELLAFVLEGADAALLDEALFFGEVPLIGEFLFEEPSQLFDEVSAGGDRGVVLFDELFDVFDEHRLLGAFGAALLAADADEVRVDGPEAVLVVGDDQPVATGAAPHGALEVVVVLADLLTGVALLGEQLLDPGPGLHRHERFVPARVLLAPVADDPLVVGVLQQRVKVRQHERLGRGLRSGGAGEAPLGGFGEQVPQVPLAGGVLLEHPLHDRAPDWVDFDGADLSAVLHLADVEVPGGGLADGTAGLGLLDAAFDDFVGEVAAVELGDRAHDPVQQHPRGGVVDVLSARHQRDPGTLERQIDLDVVGAVASQPIHLVDDHVGGGVLGDVFEHPLQLRSIGAAGALAHVGELGDHDGAEVLGLAAACLTLGGNRVALGLATGLSLFLGGDPQVEDRSHGAFVPRAHGQASVGRGARDGSVIRCWCMRPSFLM